MLIRLHTVMNMDMVVASCLTTKEMKNVQDFTALYSFRLCDNFSEGVTHVIIKAGRNFLCERRTLKYIQGIASKVWIVSYDWVLESLESNSLLDEEKYEIIGDSVLGTHFGPFRARTNKNLLFDCHEICLIGNYTHITDDEMIDLAARCGAIIVAVPYLFIPKEGLFQVTIFDSITVMKTQIQDFCNEYKVRAVVKDWMLDSICQHRLLPFTDYPNVKPNK